MAQFPDPDDCVSIGPGTHKIEIRHHDPPSKADGDEHRVEILLNDAVVLQAKRPAAWHPSGGWSSGGTFHDSQTFDPEEPVELHRRRFHNPTAGGGSTGAAENQPANGILLWIDRHGVANEQRAPRAGHPDTAKAMVNDLQKLWDTGGGIVAGLLEYLGNTETSWLRDSSKITAAFLTLLTLPSPLQGGGAVFKLLQDKSLTFRERGRGMPAMPQAGGRYIPCRWRQPPDTKQASGEAGGRHIPSTKSNTSKHINEKRQAVLKFHWQDGYGAFTVSRSMVDAVTTYIDRQMEHHRKRSFQDEFLQMLKDHDVDFDPKYIWE